MIAPRIEIPPVTMVMIASASRLAQVQYAPHDSILLVAHNDTLQELLKNYLHEEPHAHVC